ncbi:MAG: hypothetical protein EAZ92_14220 [Candidatus Kapaibacterium sp.]|nr:MAG: hypothetical protein EAZ92_14220 [Candidatus Kapabacteria bacterium]
MKSFQKWNVDTAGKAFGIKQRPKLDSLEKWLTEKHPATDEERRDVLKCQTFLRNGVDYWNEDELKMNFIGPLMLAVNFHHERYNVFYQRKITSTVQGIQLHGTVDCVVATGRVEPDVPFFFLHEYKRQRSTDADPLAQLLTAMLAARELNQVKLKGTPTLENKMYGCYVLGRLWFFVVLDGSEYAQSRAFDTTQDDDMFAIISLLKAVKVNIENYLANES